MIKKLTLVRPALFAALLCGVSAASSLAQGPLPAAPNPPGSPGTPPPFGQHGPPRGNPLFDALDTNHDGTISAEEIANASASLKSLLKNGSDHLTRDDLRPAGGPPPPPPHAGPAPDDHAGPGRGREDGERPHHPPHGPGDVEPGHEQAGGNFDRPRFHRDEQREDRREMRRDFRRHDEDMAEGRPFPRRERPAGRQGPPRPERDDRDHDARPMHHDEAGPGEHPAPHGPPPMPLFDALDANHDGTLSADEITNASAALKGLLKNGSDHLTRDDLRPAGGHPPMGH